MSFVNFVNIFFLLEQGAAQEVEMTRHYEKV